MYDEDDEVLGSESSWERWLIISSPRSMYSRSQSSSGFDIQSNIDISLTMEDRRVW